MINDLDIVQWEYLLSPEFELINSAGKPLTGGWIEVYLHGTRDKYYCALDFSGTLHPFKIPLDSIGANVVLADPNNAYDVYVYNKFGSLIMSRYNVKCHGGGSGSSTYVGDRLYYGQFKATDVATQAGLTRVTGNIDVDNGRLELKQGMSYHITLRGEFVVNEVSNVDTVLSYIEYSAVKPINVNVDYTKPDSQYFEISYDIYRLAEDMDYPVSFMQSNGLVKNLVVEVHSLSNLATSSTREGSEYEPGWGIVIQNNVISVDPSILNDYATHEEVIAAVSGVTGVGPGEVYTAGDYISIEDNVISVTGIDPDEYATHDEVISAVTSINLDEYATHEEVYNSSVTAINLVTGMIPEEQVQSDWDQEDDSEPDYIKNKPHIPSIELNSGDQVTAIDGHTIAGTGGSEYNEGFGIDISNGEISIDTNIVALASAVPQAQVQSDWDQADDTQVDFIKNKPDLSVYATHDELAGVTGILQQEIDNIDLSDYSTHTEVYNATVTAIQVATGAIPEMPEEEEVEFEEINLSDYALASAIPDVSNLASHTEVYEATVTAIQLVTGLIPEVDSFATRNEVTAVSAVLHEEINDVAESIIHYQAGEGIDITNDTISLSDPISLEAGSGINFTTSGDTVTINADPVDLSDYVTHEELIESVSAVTGMGEYGQFYCAACTGTAELGKVKGTLSVTNDGKVSLKKGCSYHVTVRGGVDVDPADNTYGAFGLTEFITGNSINSNIDRTIEDTQYFEISYDLYNLSADTDYQFGFTNVGGAVKGLYVEIHEIGHVGSGSGGAVTGTAEYDAGWGINIVNNVISFDPTVIPEQVQSDWAETASALPSFIKNKPVEYDLVAGQNISIAVTGTNVVISSTGGSGSTTYTEGFGIDISNNEIAIDPNVVALASAVNPDNVLTYEVSTWNDFRTMLDSGTNGVFLKDNSEYATDGIYDIGVLTHYDASSANFIRIMDGMTGTGNGRARLYTLTSAGAWSRSYVKLAPQVQGGFGIDTGYNYATDIETLSINTGVVALASAVPVIELNGDSQVTAIDGHALAGGGSGGTTYTAGTGIDITSDVISVDNTVAMKTDIPELPEEEEVEFEELNLSDYALASAVPTVQLDSNNQVTAIDGHTLAGGGGGDSYTEGFGIDISNNEISIDPSVVALVSAIPADNIVIFDDSQRYNTGTNIYRTNNALKSAFLAGKVIILKLGYYSYLPGPVADRNTIEYAICTGADEDGSYIPNSVYGKFYFTTYGGESSYAHYEITIDISNTDWADCFTAKYWSSENLAHMSDIPSTANFATKSELNSVEAEVETVSGLITPELPVVAGDGINIQETNNQIVISSTVSGSTYTAGTGIDIASDVISIDNTVALKTDIPTYTAASGVKLSNNVISLDEPVQLIAGDNVSISVSGVSAVISAQGGGSTYTQGTGIDITNDVISVDNTVAMKTEVTAAVQAATGLIPTNINPLITANITDIQVVNSLPGSPVSTVLYLIPEV